MRARTAAGAAATAAALVLTGCGAAAEPQSAEQSAAQRTTAEEMFGADYNSPSRNPEPTPSPDGTFTGACDYTLGDEYALIGDVEAENTGNIGMKVKVTIKWQQMGYDPITESETVKVKPGQTEVVRFNKTVSGTVIDRVQSWLDSHSELCKYKGVMVDTFGEPQDTQ